MAAQPLSPEKIARRTVAGAPMKLEWNPSLKTYRARCLQQLKVPGRPRVLPDAFPQRLESPLAWTARDLDEVEYVVRLTPEDVEEANAALQYFAGIFSAGGCLQYADRRSVGTADVGGQPADLPSAQARGETEGAAVDTVPWKRLFCASGFGTH